MLSFTAGAKEKKIPLTGYVVSVTKLVWFTSKPQEHTNVLYVLVLQEIVSVFLLAILAHVFIHILPAEQ